jgi:hypothetical protein
MGCMTKKKSRSCIHCGEVATFEKKKTVKRLTIRGSVDEKVDVYRCSCGKPTWTF